MGLYDIILTLLIKEYLQIELANYENHFCMICFAFGDNSKLPSINHKNVCVSNKYPIIRNL